LFFILEFGILIPHLSFVYAQLYFWELDKVLYGRPFLGVYPEHGLNHFLQVFGVTFWDALYLTSYYLLSEG